jgi:hypothetical protein
MAPDPSPNTIEQGDEAIGFFSLPRELRDRIYDMAKKDHRVKIKSIIYEFRAAIPEKRLVSRQFKAEYDERSAVNTFVHIFDMFDMCAFEHFPRLAIKSCYLELAWTTEDAYAMPCDLDPDVPDELFDVSLRDRMRTLQRLVDRLPEIKDVHVEVWALQAPKFKDTADAMIASPVLTSFSIKNAGFIHFEAPVSGGSRIRFIPWSSAKGNVDFVIWSRAHGFLVDNTDEEKGMQEVVAARERYLNREAAEMGSREDQSRASDTLDCSNGASENAREGSAGEESS